MKKFFDYISILIFAVIALVAYFGICYLLSPILSWKPSVPEMIMVVVTICALIKFIQYKIYEYKINKAIENGIYCKNMYEKVSYLVRDIGRGEYELTSLNIHINVEERKYVCTKRENAEPQIISKQHLIELLTRQGYSIYPQGFIKSCLVEE